MESSTPLYNEVIELVKKTDLPISMEKLAADVSFIDLGVDSIDMARMLLAVEEHYEIEFDGFEMREMNKFSSFLGIIQKKMASKATC